MARETRPNTRRPDRAAPSRDPAREVLDFDLYLPTVLSKLVAKLRRSANGFFGPRFGITLLEWRILSLLAAEGSSSAYAIWTAGELDKAAVSRAIKEMQRRGLLAIGEVATSPRRKLSVSLTTEGRQLYDETFEEVLRRHQRLLGDLSREDVLSLLRVLNMLEGRIPAMASDADASATFRPTRLRDPPRPIERPSDRRPPVPS